MDVRWISSGHEEKAWGINRYTLGVHTFFGSKLVFCRAMGNWWCAFAKA